MINIVETEITSKATRKGKEKHTIISKRIEDRELISELENQAGRFILAPNILSEAELEASEILVA